MPAKKKTATQATHVAEGPTETLAPKSTEVKLGAAKGRPMLQWVGKKPLSRVTAFPAQFVEAFDPTAELASPSGVQASGNLFYGDNKEVLAHLLANGYRGKVDLVYIDPPFDSAADYVRKVTLRGKSALNKIEGESYSLGEQVQYTDIWANDNYLQFMFERLILLKELLKPNGVIFLHCDDSKIIISGACSMKCLARIPSAMRFLGNVQPPVQEAAHSITSTTPYFSTLNLTSTFGISNTYPIQRSISHQISSRELMESYFARLP
jgi:hypothetical protein